MSAAAMLDHALAHAANGWPVFPLAPREKVPLIRKENGGNGCHDATTDVATIEGWYTRSPKANIGIAMGAAAGVWALDVDTDKGGAESLAKLEAEHGPLPPTLRARTGSGGWHYFFKWPANRQLRNRVRLRGADRKRMPGLDTRAGGGYVVAAPSEHPNGNRYEWDDPDVEVADAPPWLLDLLDPPRVERKASTYTPGKVTATDRLQAYIRAGLVNECTELAKLRTGDGRRSAIREVAYHFGGYVAAGGISRAEVLAEVVRAGEASGWPGNVDAEAADALTAGEGAPLPLPVLEDRPNPNAKPPPEVPSDAPPFAPVEGYAEVGERASRALDRASALEARPRRVKPDEADGDEPADDLPRIILGPDLGATVTLAIEVVADDPAVYQRGGKLVRIVEVKEPDQETLEITPFKRAGIVDRMSSRIRFCRVAVNPDGERVLRRVPPPATVGEMVLERSEYPGVRPIAGIVRSPMLRPDGTILQTAGYDSSTGLFYEPDVDFPAVDPNAGRDDAVAAVQRILALVAQFPWSGEIAKSAWLAALLTVFARTAIRGAVPLFMVQGNAPGTGKGKLAKLIGILAGGHHVTSQFPNEEECRKSILAYAMEGHRIVLIDNVRGAFGWPSLEMAITEMACGNRALGTNDAPRVSALMVWLATLNAPIIVGDMPRRMLPINLFTKVERPEDRDDFTIGNIEQYFRDNRPALVRDVLTILFAYCKNKRPKPPKKLKSFGSFEEWSALVRGVLVWTGQPDPLDARGDLASMETPEVAALRRLHTHIAEQFRDTPFVARDLLERAGFTGALFDTLAEFAPPRPPETGVSPKSLGWALKRHRDRVLDGRSIRHVDETRDGTRWRLAGV